MRRCMLSLLLSTGLLATAIPDSVAEESKDLYFGEAIFYANQARYFDAIARLDTELGQYNRVDEPGLDSLHLYIDSAKFSVGDFELYYRMHQRAGRAIKAVIEGNVEPVVRNEAIYRLSRILLQKNQPANALHAIEKMKGKLPDHLREDILYLKALIYIANKKPTAAIELFSDLKSSSRHTGFADYNLGIALLQKGEKVEGYSQLEKAGLNSGSSKAALSIRDKSNLALGFMLLESNKPKEAKKYLNRVRLNGPFSNRALLGSGWADVAAKQYHRAIVPWTILAKRNVTDRAVQEVMLGLPFAYGKINLHGKAAVLYGRALESFDSELAKLDASITSIREGKFLKALVQEELRQDKNWVIKLRDLPDAPETYYLMQLMASHDFQESLKNYFDLEEIRKRLIEWEDSIKSYQQLVAIRREYYKPLLPKVEKKFQLLDSRMRLRVEQRNNLENKLQAMLIAPRPQFLASVSERIYSERIHLMEKKVKHESETSDARQRVARLRGVLDWQINTQYHERLTKAFKSLRDLDGVVADLKNTYRLFIHTRQAATQSYEGYDDVLNTLRIKVLDAQERVKTAMLRQSHMIETMAVNELDKRRKRIEGDQIKARFALAESYDLAQKAQSDKAFKKHAEAEARKAEKIADKIEKQARKKAETDTKAAADKKKAAEKNPAPDKKGAK